MKRNVGIYSIFRVNHFFLQKIVGGGLGWKLMGR